MPTILVIDDDLSTRLLLTDILEEDGYEVVTAETGFSGIQVAEAEIPDVILLDIDMPGGSGTVVIKKLKGRSLTKEIPVIMITGHGETHIMVETVRSGARDYILKPWLDGEIERSVRWAIKSVGLAPPFPEESAC